MDIAFSINLNSVLPRPVQLGLILCGVAVISLKVISFLSYRSRNPLRLPFPPGPKGYPLIGNLLDVPASFHWRVYDQWAKKYGDIMSFEVLGQRTIILNSLEAVEDLFEKRSANYSDKPRLPMLVELMDFGYIFSLIPYGPWWRRHRRMFNKHFHAGAVTKYHPVQSREARKFLNKLLRSPEGFSSHIREALASTILNIAYGIEIQGSNDPYIKNVEESISGFNVAGIPGSFLVDFIPALKYIPSWIPGAGFKKTGAHWTQVNRNVRELPFNAVAQQMKDGTAGPSLTATLISALPEGDAKILAEETTLAKNVTAVAYLAGADTVSTGKLYGISFFDIFQTISALQTFFLVMALYPDAQRKAQMELDAVIGSDRLPEFGDRPLLPYVNALVKETMRWNVVVPLALAHKVTNDDIYRGYFIPKGSTIIGNAWGLMHDKTAFQNPEDFFPERFLKNGRLDPEIRQPEVSVYGFGRRICPGRFFADNTLFMLVASTLYAFSIGPTLDETGQPKRLSARMTSGTLSYPEPFDVEIKPRSPNAEALVRDSLLVDH